MAPDAAPTYAVAVDPSGRLAWRTNDVDGDHAVSVLTERVSDEYVAFLRERGVSVESLYLDLFGPIARRLGEMWEDDACDFSTVTVALGEMRTDDDGHLLVLGGFGKSASPANKPLGGLHSPDWYDDTSDGPVTAEVIVGGQTYTATGAPAARFRSLSRRCGSRPRGC